MLEPRQIPDRPFGSVPSTPMARPRSLRPRSNRFGPSRPWRWPLLCTRIVDGHLDLDLGAHLSLALDCPVDIGVTSLPAEALVGLSRSLPATFRIRRTSSSSEDLTTAQFRPHAMVRPTVRASSLPGAGAVGAGRTSAMGAGDRIDRYVGPRLPGTAMAASPRSSARATRRFCCRTRPACPAAEGLRTP
jgi:hypothetical protein